MAMLTAAQRLDPLRDQVHQLALGFVMLVEEQVELVEGGPPDLPVMLLVHVPQGHGISEELIEDLDAGRAHGRVERYGKPRDAAEMLDLLGVLDNHRTRALIDRDRIVPMLSCHRDSFRTVGMAVSLAGVSGILTATSNFE
jgi:hypothetical protein